MIAERVNGLGANVLSRLDSVEMGRQGGLKEMVLLESEGEGRIV